MEKEWVIIEMEIFYMIDNLFMVKEKEKEKILMKMMIIIQENLKMI